jgi:hypothetical protein
LKTKRFTPAAWAEEKLVVILRRGARLVASLLFLVIFGQGRIPDCTRSLEGSRRPRYIYNRLKQPSILNWAARFACRSWSIGCCCLVAMPFSAVGARGSTWLAV